MAKNTEVNALECNKRARIKYDKEHYKKIGAGFKNEEMEMIESYCKEHGITKSQLVRDVLSEVIDFSDDEEN